MTAAAEEMDEVVVVAYGRAKKASYTGSATTIKGESFENRATTNVLSELRDLFQEYKFKVLQVNQVHNLQFELEVLVLLVDLTHLFTLLMEFLIQVT
jgi:hypothetical protein